MDLLLVEDDPVFGKALQKGLNEAGHECHWVRSGEKGWDDASSQRFDAIVDFSGVDRFVDTPVKRYSVAEGAATGRRRARQAAL